MSNTAINTAQNVTIDYHVASLGNRILGFLIDLLLFAVYIFIIEYFVIKLSDVADGLTTLGISQLVLVPIMTYSLIMNILFKGRTIGKFIMGTKVVMVDGSPARWSNFLTSWLLRFVDLWISTCTIGTLSIIFSDKNQRLGDAASDTMVIDTRKKTKISHTILEDVDQDYQPSFTVVSTLTDHDINEIKEIFRLAESSRDYNALNNLRLKVESLLDIKSDMRDAPFIRTILKDYTYLTAGQ